MTSLDLIGEKYGDLTVLKKAHKSPHGFQLWFCVCSCGTKGLWSGNTLRCGHTKSCGCQQYKNRKGRVTHGYTKQRQSSEYQAWNNAKRRCTDSRRHNFHRYGARGIAMCKEWRKDFGAFIAHIGKKPHPHLTLERIDNDRGYEPGNVRWATYREQAFNRSNSRKNKPH